MATGRIMMVRPCHLAVSGIHVHSIISCFCFERNLDTSPQYMQPTAKLILTSTPPESSQDITADGQFRPVEGVSTDNPITVRSQSDLQSDHSPITVRSYVLLPFHITRLKRIYRFERGSFFSCEHLKLLVKYMIGL